MWDEREIPGVCWCPQDTHSAWRSSASGFSVKSCLFLRCCSHKCPCQGISVLEGSNVLMSTGSAVDHSFAWLSKYSFKHTLKDLVIYFFVFYNLYWGLTEQNTKRCYSVVMAKPSHLRLIKARAPDQLLLPFPPLALCQTILCLAVIFPHFTHRFFLNALISRLLSQLLKHKQLLMCQTFII